MDQARNGNHYNSTIGESYSDRVRYYRRQREAARAERNRRNHSQRYTNIDFDEALHEFKNKSKAEKVISDAGRNAKRFAEDVREKYLSDSFAQEFALYRDDENGILGGVCAGIADKMNWDVKNVRIVTAISGLIFTIPTVVAYAVASYALRNKRLSYYGRKDERSFWKSASSTSKEYQAHLDAQFEDLEKEI